MSQDQQESLPDTIVPISQPRNIPSQRSTINVPNTRMVVVESIFQQTINQQPQSAGQQFVRWLTTGNSSSVNCAEKMYNPERIIKVGQEWKVIDTGWIEKVGMLLITNKIPKVPMRAESVRDTLAVLEISMRQPSKITSNSKPQPLDMWDETPELANFPYDRVPDFLILPGESMRCLPTNVKDMAVRCRDGEGLYSVVVCPE